MGKLLLGQWIGSILKHDLILGLLLIASYFHLFIQAVLHTIRQ